MATYRARTLEATQCARHSSALMTPTAPDVNAAEHCMNDGCDNAAKLKCPTCIKLELPIAKFCSQDCFKSAWPLHKFLHQVAPATYNPWPGYTFTGSLRPSQQTPKRTVPATIRRPDYADHPEGVSLEERNSKATGQIIVNPDEDIESMRVSGRLGREVLNEAAAAVDVGVTTDELDRIVHEACIERECYPSPLGYYKFPKSVCTSVNEVVCHGIPDLRPLENGDICNIDVTIYHRGFHGDLNETLLVGKRVSEEDRKLVAVTYDCISKAIDIVRPGVKYREIGNVIQKVANASGFSVVKQFCGHGINRLFHTAPNVAHYASKQSVCSALPRCLHDALAENKAVGIMKAGHTFTIEPMINAGKYGCEIWNDDWTAVTVDGKRSAQFEQTLLVTDEGCDILTKRASGRPWFMDQLDKNYK